MGSLPLAFTCLPCPTKLVVPLFESNVPSKVSVRASCTRKILERVVVRVDDSDRTSKAAETAAIGPEVNVITVAWGR